MSHRDKQNLRERITRGMLQAHEKMLRDKLARSQTVIYADSQGEPVFMSPRHALKEFLER